MTDPKRMDPLDQLREHAAAQCASLEASSPDQMTFAHGTVSGAHGAWTEVLEMLGDARQASVTSVSRPSDVLRSAAKVIDELDAHAMFDELDEALSGRSLDLDEQLTELDAQLRAIAVVLDGEPPIAVLKPARSVSQNGMRVIADVREFYDAVMEHNPRAMMQDRDQHPAALIRPMTRQRLLQEERDEHHNAQLVDDLPGVLDGIVDQVVILVGTARIQFGEARLERALDAVHVSNMAKRFPDGTFHVLEDGTILKPPGWVPPDIAAIIEDRQP